MNCQKCGTVLEDTATVCPNCGEPQGEQPVVETVVQPVVEPVYVPDTNTKLFAILGYLFNILFLIPLFISKENKWAMSHANNAGLLLIGEVIAGVISALPIVDFIGSGLSIGCLVLMIFGIVAAANNRGGETVPLLGQINILK